MEEKRENLSGMIAGTLLIASALINFAEFNIERGFCDYPILIFSVLAVLASGIVAAAVMKGNAFWLVGIGTFILLLCRLQKPGDSAYIYMAECGAILVILIFYRLKSYKYEALNLDWSYLVGIVFCGIWIIWQLHFIKGFMNKEMLWETAVLRLEACQKGN